MRRACRLVIGSRRPVPPFASRCTCSSTQPCWLPSAGGSARAERLLDGHAETPVHAWLAVVRSYERLLSGDFDIARHWARRAVDVGSRRDPAAAALGRVAEARSLILQGDVTQGLELLNEAAVATVSGEIDPLSTGVVFCELVCALQALGQYDLAEQWTEAMERWHHGQPVGSLHGRCRVHRAEILRLRGSCAEAEQEALLACEELRPYLRRELGWPLTELGRIRLRKGDIAGRRGGISGRASGRMGSATGSCVGTSGARRRRPCRRVHSRRPRPSGARAIERVAAEYETPSRPAPGGAGGDRDRRRRPRVRPVGSRRIGADRGDLSEQRDGRQRDASPAAMSTRRR